MNRIIRFAIALAMVAVFVSCNKNEFSLDGTFENGAGKMIYIEELSPDGPIFLDSIKLDSKGEFTFKYEMPYPTFYNIHVTEDDFIQILPQYGEKIHLEADYNRFSFTYKVSGSEESELLWQLQDMSNIGVCDLQKIVDIDRENREKFTTKEDYDKAHRVTDSLFNVAYLNQQDFVVGFIKDNQGSLATLIALYKPYNNHALLSPEYNFDYYEYVLEGLQNRYPDNPHTEMFYNTVQRLKYINMNKREASGMALDAPTE